MITIVFQSMVAMDTKKEAKAKINSVSTLLRNCMHKNGAYL